MKVFWVRHSCDLGSCDELILSETSSGFVTRAICDHASDLISSELLDDDRPSNLEQSDWPVRIFSL